MEAKESSTKSLKDILDIIFKRKGQMLAFFAATVCTVATGTYTLAPKYEATAQILVKLGRESVFVPTGGNMRPIINYNREGRINSEIEILKSLSLAEKVVAVLGPSVIAPHLNNRNRGLLTNLKKKVKAIIGKQTPVLSAQERAALKFETAMAAFQKTLLIEGVKKSNVIQISYRHPDPKIAAMIVNTQAELYLEHHLDIHKSAQSHAFFQQQSEVLNIKLKRSEEELRSLKRQYKVSSLDEQRSLLLKQESDLQTDYNKTMSLVVETEKRILQIQHQLATTPKSIAQEAETDQNQHLISTLEARLVELELEQKDLLTKYTDHSRLVLNAKDEIKVVREKLAEHHARRYEKKTSGINPTYQRLQESLYNNQAEYRALKAKSETQMSQLEDYRHNLAALDQVEMELNHLKQEVEMDRENYRLYLSKYEETRISDAMDSKKISSVSLIEPARVPLKPVSPRVMLNIMLAVFLGAFGGLSLAFFMEYLDDSLKRPEDVETYLDLPVLASIPKLKGLG